FLQVRNAIFHKTGAVPSLMNARSLLRYLKEQKQRLFSIERLNHIIQTQEMCLLQYKYSLLTPYGLSRHLSFYALAISYNRFEIKSHSYDTFQTTFLQKFSHDMYSLTNHVCRLSSHISRLTLD